jgi:hypothetical protein
MRLVDARKTVAKGFKRVHRSRVQEATEHIRRAPLKRMHDERTLHIVYVASELAGGTAPALCT